VAHYFDDQRFSFTFAVDNDIDGSILLNDLNHEVLKNDLGITSFGIRCNILKQVRGLQRKVFSFDMLP
jgi:predicted acetyltransferase